MYTLISQFNRLLLRARSLTDSFTVSSVKISVFNLQIFQSATKCFPLLLFIGYFLKHFISIWLSWLIAFLYCRLALLLVFCLLLFFSFTNLCRKSFNKWMSCRMCVVYVWCACNGLFFLSRSISVYVLITFGHIYLNSLSSVLLCTCAVFFFYLSLTLTLTHTHTYAHTLCSVPVFTVNLWTHTLKLYFWSEWFSVSHSDSKQ